MDLSVTAIDAEGVAVITVRGEVDIYSASTLRTFLDHQVGEGFTKLIVDLDELDFLDSTGLGVLVGRLKIVRQQDGWVRIVCTRERILRLFEITGLEKVFPIHPDRAAALAQTDGE